MLNDQYSELRKMTSYYCIDCGKELPAAWAEMYFTDNVTEPEKERGIQCPQCHKYDEQLNKGRDDE